MPKNEVALFDPANVPAHIANFNEQESNIQERTQVPSLTYKGKVWTINQGGVKQTLMKRDADGEEEPRTNIPLIILQYAKRRGRGLYEGAYDDSKPAMPICWSPDGVTPDDNSSKKQSDKCATCPMAAKGSKVTDAGTSTTACAQYRMVAVQPYKKWDMPPLRLRLAITSDFDGRNQENEAKGYYAFSQFMDMLRAQGIKHTASVVTRVKFDASTAYPKVLFSAVQWLTAEELETVAEISKNPDIESLLNATYTPNGGDGVKNGAVPADPEDEEGPVVAPPKPPKTVATKPAATKPAKPKVAPVEDEDVGEVQDPGAADADVADLVAEAEADDDDAEAAAAKLATEAMAKLEAIKARKVKDAEKAATARKAAAAAPTADDDEDEAPIKVAPPKAPGKPATAAAPAKPAVTKPSTAAAPKGTPTGTTKPVSKEVGEIIDDWD